MRSNLLRSICRAEQGSISLLLVLASVILVGFAGFAIDMARGYAVKQHLQKAVDAATLAATKVLEDTTHGADYPKEVGEAYFWNNWREGYLGAGSVTLDVTFDRDAGKATVNAKVDLEPIIMGFIGGEDFHFDTSAEAQRKVASLEIALAIDNTASMAYGENSNEDKAYPQIGVNDTRMAAAKSAAKVFLDTLFEGKDEVANMWMSVVPFSNVVNIGKDNASFLKSDAGLGSLKWVPTAMNRLPTGIKTKQNSIFAANDEWRGCVFERGFGKAGLSQTTGRDQNDDNPGTEGFYPYNVPMRTYIQGVRCAYRAEVGANCPGGWVCNAWKKQCGPDGKPPCDDVCTSSTCPSYVAGTVRDPIDPDSLTQCRNVSDSGYTAGTKTAPAVKNTYCSFADNADYGKPCDSNTLTNCVPNRGPLIGTLCFAWERPTTTPRPEWQDQSDSDYYSGGSFSWPSPMPVARTEMMEAASWDYAATPTACGSKNTCGFWIYKTLTDLKRTTDGGFTVRVQGDDISSCGNGAQLKGKAGSSLYPQNGYHYCARSSRTVDKPRSWPARWVAAYPLDDTTPTIGGWGNSGCGLPILPLSAKRTDIEARIDAMEVPPVYFASGALDKTVPLMGYQGTLLNQGLVWGWRTLSSKWKGYWSGIADGALPKDISDPSTPGHKAVILLTDGANFMQREGDLTRIVSTHHYLRSVIVPDTNWSSAGLQSPMYLEDSYSPDTSAFGNLADGWLRRDLGSGASISWSDMATETSFTGSGASVPKYYNELTKRFLKTCDLMKAANVRVYIIVFAIADLKTDAVLKDADSMFKKCTDSSRYFVAATKEELEGAFKDIAAELTELRLLK